jgi:hypothetical protein
MKLVLYSLLPRSCLKIQNKEELSQDSFTVKSLLPLPAYIHQSTYLRGLQRKDLGLVAHALPIQLMLRAYVKIVHDKFSHCSNCCGRCGRHLAFCETTNAATPLKEVSLSALPKFKWVWQML